MMNEKIGGYINGNFSYAELRIYLDDNTEYKPLYIHRKKLNRKAIDGFPMRNIHISFRDKFGQLWQGVCWNSDWNQYTTFRKVK